jgi:hypothetical protein
MNSGLSAVPVMVSARRWPLILAWKTSPTTKPLASAKAALTITSSGAAG